jgi:hypothetical protein
MTLFDGAKVAGTFLGFSEGGLEFHAELVLPYDNNYQSMAMHGQFVLVALENDNEAVLGRITTISSQGRLVGSAGEDYAIRAVREDRPIPENLRDQYLKYKVDIRILGVLRVRASGQPPVFVASHRRLPHVGSKVAFLSDSLLRQVAGASLESETAAEIGFMALGEFVYAGDDQRVGNDGRLEVVYPKVIPRFDVEWLVSRRTFVFARAGFGKSNLVKLLFADLYSLPGGPHVKKRGDRSVPVGTVIFDPDGEYFWPDDKGRPGLCDVPDLRERLVVFTDREGPSPFYNSFVVDQVRLDVRELPASRVVSLVISADRLEQQNVQKLMALHQDGWRRLVDAVWISKNATDLDVFYRELRLKFDGTQDAEATAARSNMTRIVNGIHDPSSQLLRALKESLREGKLCVIDVSRMHGAQGLALAGVILQDIFQHNQDEFTKADSQSIPTIAVIEEAQSVLSSNVSHGEGPFVEWVKEGRKYDLGAVLVTQQPGSLPGELLSQGDNWFIFHLLSSGDLRALKNANANYSDDLLSTLLNEPLIGHGIFWSSAGEYPYPISIRTLSFEDTFETIDPTYNTAALDNYASRLRERFQGALRNAAAEAGEATVGGTFDASETLNRGAIYSLGTNDEFYQQVTTGGVLWVALKNWLVDALPETIGDREQWVFSQYLVERALDEILGKGAWKKERRPKPNDSSKTLLWYIATEQARSRDEFENMWSSTKESESDEEE